MKSMHNSGAVTSIDKRLERIKTRFTVTIVILATASVATLAGILYVTNVTSFNDEISPQKIESLTDGYPAVAQYIVQQKQNEAHFVTLANLVKSDQQQLIGSALMYAVLPVLLAVGAVAVVVARKLLKPIKESFQSQEQFLQDAAHELRNPLAALYAVAQEAKAQPNKAAVAETMDTIERQVRQVVKLNEDLLALEKAKTAIPEKSSRNISNLTHDVVDGLTFKANSSQVKIKVDIPSDIFAPVRDEDWVCICNNLIDNAIKYSKRKGTTTVTLRKIKKRIRLTITDSGIGIPDDEMQKIGNRFYRASNSGRVPGTGLGLAIVNQIVAGYKGTLTIRSVRGKSTIVVIDI